MNNPITDIVLKYAKEKNTDYALLINGKWGCGKTYYWKNILSQEIKKLHLDYGQNTYKPIYMSLNGISNCNQIDELLINSLSSVGEISKYIKKFDSAIGTIKNIKDTVASVLEIGSRAYYLQRKKLRELFICFDDLERISSKLKYDEVLGFINTNFIEHNNIKTIFLTNLTRGELKEKNKETLEKYFEHTFKFDFNTDSIIGSISKLYIEDDKNYFDFLQENQKYVVELINDAKIENIRTIKFSMRILREIFRCANQDDIKKLSRAILLFTISVANEFKRGEIEPDEVENPKLYTTIFQYTHRSEIRDLLESQENKNSELKEDRIYNYNDLYFKKYVKDKRKNDFHYFNSIYRFILTGSIERDAIKDEINETLGKVNDWDFIYNNIYNFKDLPDDKFQKYYNELIKYVKTGKYSIYKYLSLYNFVSNVIGIYIPSIQKKEIFKIFMEGLSIKENEVNLPEYQKDAIRTLISGTNISTDYAQNIKNKIIEIHNNHQKNKTMLKVNNFFDFISKNRENINEQFSEIANIPIFSIYTYTKLFELIKKCENYTLVTINDLIINLYNDIREKRIEEHEIEIEINELIKLKSSLTDYLESLNIKEYPIKKGNIRIIIDSVSEIEKA